MDELKLYKAYLVYGTRVVMHLCWAENEDHVCWSREGEPRPVIEEMQKNPGPVLCHHIADHNLYKTLTELHSSEAH